MTNDFRAVCRSDEEIQILAAKIRRNIDSLDGQVDVLAALGRQDIETTKGKKKLRLEVVDDYDMGDIDASTRHFEDIVVISFKKSVHTALRFGDPRARMTAAGHPH